MLNLVSDALVLGPPDGAVEAEELVQLSDDEGVGVEGDAAFARQDLESLDVTGVLQDDNGGSQSN